MLSRSISLRIMVSLCMGMLVAGCRPSVTTPQKAAIQESVPYPLAEIASGNLSASIYLPDAEDGYYRGVRFDWSGMLGHVQLGERTFFSKLKGIGDGHKPTVHDHGVGPCEEFGMKLTMPLGYKEATQGETFIKIGVGLLERLDDEPYLFNRAYRLVEAYPWKVEGQADHITMTQTCSDPRGWGYVYTKTVSVDGETRTLTIDHELKNTGQKSIVTDHYSHNMMLIDGIRAHNSYRLSFPMPIKTAQQASLTEKGVQIIGNEFRYEDLKCATYCELANMNTVESNQVTLHETNTGASIILKGNWKPSHYAVYSEPTSICPEPFLLIDLAPDQVTRWANHYTFSTGQE